MNKLILALLLVVCLVTAHAAIVKRDAPVAPNPEFDITKQLAAITTKIEETFSPDNIKDAVSKLGEQIKTGINNFMPTDTPKA